MVFFLYICLSSLTYYVYKKTMMKSKLLSFVTFLAILSSCKKPIQIEIDSSELIENVKTLSSDSYEGRAFSKPGNYKARNFISEKFKDIGLQTTQSSGYVQEFVTTLKGKDRYEIYPVITKPSEDYSNIKDTIVNGANVIGLLKGQTEKTIVISAHFDHLGIKNNKIYNGADDNASGTAALFAIAKYFKDKPTKHNLLFTAFDGKEIGSLGAEYFLKNYTEKENIALNINMDMIAHSDYDPEIFACGTFYNPDLKSHLKDIYSEKVILLFGHDDESNKEQSDWTFSSDHRVFHQQKIPFIYFGVPDHKDYHRPTDTFYTINQEFYIEAVKVIIKSIEKLDTELE